MRSNMKKQMSSAPKTSMRPKKRPMMDEAAAPKTSMRPKKRPEDLMQRNAEAGAVARGNRAAQREAEDYRTIVEGKMKAGGKVKKSYKSGGKVRGCGMARGGAVRQCKMVKMKGS